jgi:hypothetical protein
MATQYAFGKIVTNGLVLALDAADKNSYPGSGTTWRDMSGNNSNSTLTNSPTFNSANGGSIVFDGVDDYTTTTAGQAFYQYTNQLSVCWWIKRNGDLLTGAGCGQSTLSLDDMTSNVWLMHGNTNNTVTFYVNDNGAWKNIASSILDNNTWYFLAGTINTSNIIMYINGTLYGTSTGISTGIVNNSNSVVVLGRDPRASSGRYLNGSIANIQVYNRTLSASEILQNYNAQKSRFNL